MIKPTAVLISDIHYSLPTLEVADAALRLAINKANELKVPLIVAGDLHDTKANLRAECVNAMLETFHLATFNPYVIIGNHDKINEKSINHSLEFLSPCATIVNRFRYGKSHTNVGTYTSLACYHNDADELRGHLNNVNKGTTVIMHQGVSGSNSGEYIQDKSAITKQDVAGLRIISGHYHQRQTIQLPDGGVWDYIGNPYTLNFGEAKDPAKGFQILMSDGSLEFVPTNLRKHVVVEVTVDGDGIYYPAAPVKQNDLVWVKVTGKDLQKVTKQSIRKNLEGLDLPADFRLDLIPDETEFTPIVESGHQMSQSSLLEQTINSVSDISDEKKTKINNLWKTFV
jgi:DNA repair exonuclease SbcCD nuclease subunit